MDFYKFLQLKMIHLWVWAQEKTTMSMFFFPPVQNQCIATVGKT